MKWLVACERSQVVTSALRAAGHEAYSNDLLPAELNPDWHIQGDALEVAYDRRYGWDGLIAHPECTHMTLAGARWFYDERFPNKWADREAAIVFWKKLWGAPILRKAFENPQPLGYVMDRIGRYTQKIQPWQFGDLETKGICFWLENLKPLPLQCTVRPGGVVARVWRMPPGPDRQLLRQRFDFPGVINAMVRTWAP